MKVLLVNDTTDWCHWGCTGTSTILKERIKQIGFELDTFPARNTYQSAWPARPNEADKFNDKETYARFCRENPILFEKLKSADAVIINGEGTMHGVKDAPLNLLYLAYISKAYLHKHVEIINHSVFPEDSTTVSDQSIKDLYQLAYKNLDFIAAREPISLSILKKLDISATHSFDCLPIYLNEFFHLKNKSQVKNVVVAGSADWINANLKALARYFEWLAKQEYKINLLIGAKEYHAADSVLVNFIDDDKIVNFFKNNLSSIDWQLVDANSMDEWLTAIANASLLVSGRFHHTIAATCLNVPFVVLNSNTPKIDGLMQMLNLEPALRFDDEALHEKLMLRTAEALHLASNGHAKEVVSRLCDLAENNFNGLRSLAKSHKLCLLE